jgi:hypothetical protein
MVPDKAALAALKRLSDALGSPTPSCQMMPSSHTLLYMGDLCSKKAWS